MAIPSNKKELINAINESYHKLNCELLLVPKTLVNTKELNGHSKGTSMSVHNLVAYLVGWGNLVMKWHENKKLGRPVDFPETGYKWNDLGALANKFYNDYNRHSYEDLLLKLEITTNRILNLVENKTNKELYVDLWYNKWTLGRLIQLNTSSPYKNATGRIRQWKKNRKI